jgi:hypothetical protein
VSPEEETPTGEVLSRLGEHVERYQAIIARLADSSLRIKALTATAQAALVSVAISRGEPNLLWVAALLLLALGGLDAYYLSLERSFRAASRDLINTYDPLTADWQAMFTIDGDVTARRDFWCSLVAPATVVFYLPIAALLVAGRILS